MSDIDLATLHKTRLEEKVNYKLSWWTKIKSNTSNMSIDGYSTKSKVYNCHNKKPVATSAADKSGKNSKSVVSEKKNNNNCIDASSHSKQHKNAPIKKINDNILNKTVVNTDNKKEMAHIVNTRNNNICDNKFNINKKYNCGTSVEFDNLSDDGYFSSETRRRRSGTWP